MNQQLLNIVTKACEGLVPNAAYVIDSLLSLDDEQDLLDGSVSIEALRVGIQAWWNNMGGRHISGKPLHKRLRSKAALEALKASKAALNKTNTY